VLPCLAPGASADEQGGHGAKHGPGEKQPAHHDAVPQARVDRQEHQKDQEFLNLGQPVHNLTGTSQRDQRAEHEERQRQFDAGQAQPHAGQ